MEILDGQESAGLSAQGIADMRSVAPWMKFIAIVFLVFGAIMAIATIIMLFTIPLGGLFYGLFTFIAIYVNILLLGMGNSLTSYSTSPNSLSLDLFFKKTKIYFMIWGILIAIYLVLIVIIIAIGESFMKEIIPMIQNLQG